MNAFRVGIGYDSHRFAEGRRLVLGGIDIPHTHGLAGHSDADAVAHALADALLGAAALGDIGTHFPPTDPRWKDADSMELLRAVVALLRARGFTPANVDVSVICESPRLARHVPAMRARIAHVLELQDDSVSVKAKSNEGMGWIGKGEGLAVIAVASIRTAAARA